MEQSATVEMTVRNRLGIHARPAALIAQLCARFRSSCTFVRKDTGAEADGKSLLNLLMLGAPCGAVIVLKTVGDDAPEAAAALKELIEGGFDEQ